MEAEKFIYRTKELVIDQQGKIIKEKITEFGHHPNLGASLAMNNGNRKIKQIERDPQSFLHGMNIAETTTDSILDVEVYLVIQEKDREEELLLYSRFKSNLQNLNKEETLQKKFEKNNFNERIKHFLNLLKTSENPEELDIEPFPLPSFFKTKKLITNNAGQNEIFEVREFRPENYENYVEMKNAAMEYHNSCIPEEYNILDHLEDTIKGINTELDHSCELYLVLIQNDQENELLRLRNYLGNTLSSIWDLHIVFLCYNDSKALTQAKNKYFKRNKSKKSK